MKLIFYWTGLGFIVIGITLLSVWGLFFQGVYGTCQITDRETAGGDCCPWPDECKPCMCVTIVAYWYPAKHAIYLYPYEYGTDCWTTDDPWPMLNKDYPIGKNKTCYSPRLSSNNVKVTESSVANAERGLFISGLVCSGLGLLSISVAIVFHIISCCKDRGKYELINSAM